MTAIGLDLQPDRGAGRGLLDDEPRDGHGGGRAAGDPDIDGAHAAAEAADDRRVGAGPRRQEHRVDLEGGVVVAHVLGAPDGGIDHLLACGRAVPGRVGNAGGHAEGDRVGSLELHVAGDPEVGLDLQDLPAGHTRLRREHDDGQLVVVVAVITGHLVVDAVVEQGVAGVLGQGR